MTNDSRDESTLTFSSHLTKPPTRSPSEASLFIHLQCCLMFDNVAGGFTSAVTRGTESVFNELGRALLRLLPARILFVFHFILNVTS